MTETEARELTLLQSREAGAETPLWTAEDRAWATRLALQTAGPEADFERFLVERTRHALERLLPRDAAARRWLGRTGWRPAWVAWAGAVAFACGVAFDHVGAAQRIDVLAPPVWALIAWNLVVYLGLAWPRPGAGLRKLVARRWTAGGDAAAPLWAKPAAPLALGRAALLLHVGAAALAVGLAAGLYLRGLVLDYRAGWQSTFLDPPFVQALLSTLLAPASALTGIAVPEVAPLRDAAGAAATAPAAPWIHLYVAMLALVIVLPRGLLALVAGWRVQRSARTFALPLTGPYFDRLRQQRQGGKAFVQVLPHGEAPSPQAALGLRALLAGVLGEDIELRFAAVVGYGDEDAAEVVEAPAGTTLRVALFDLAATPEPEAQGRFIAALQGTLPVVAIADEAAFARRFAALPERAAERRAAWQRLADGHGAGFASADLETPSLDAAIRALKAALSR